MSKPIACELCMSYILCCTIGQFVNGAVQMAYYYYCNAVACCSAMARHVFNVQDEPLLRHLRDDNLRIEPEWYMPVIPMVLVNGSEGIGTGWSTKILNYDVREIVRNLRRLLDGEEPTVMVRCLF